MKSKYKKTKTKNNTIMSAELKEENRKLKEENKKHDEELQHDSNVYKQDKLKYIAKIEDQEVIIHYLNKEVDKYKKLFDEIYKENQKEKILKGIIVNEDNTIISINGIELKIGDEFGTEDDKRDWFTLKEIYVGKTGKYSLRTSFIGQDGVIQYKTIRICNSYITGQSKIMK